jgi:hypothetical protein
MAEEAVVHVGENSPEQVAFKLFHEVVSAEGPALGAKGGVNRKWILDTYAECLLAVRLPSHRLNPPHR